jgi:hypothetical protein
MIAATDARIVWWPSYKSVSRSSLLFIVTVVAVAFGARGAAGQTSSVTGDIAMTITDQSGAVMPGVIVTVISNATSTSRTLVADEYGACVAVGLPPATYAVVAELQGFVTVRLTSVTVALGERADLRIRMNVAPVAETITVSGESAAIVDASKMEVSTRVNQLALSELPVNVRDPAQFIATAPAVTPRPALAGSGYSFGGARVHNDAAFVDGVDNTDEWGRVFLAQPPLDAVKEFQVLTSNYSAEFGHASGGIVNTILKSGGSQIRGSGFYFFRDQSLAADNYFTRLSRSGSSDARAPFRQDQPGVSLGGPWGRHRLFFFTSYEWFRTLSSSAVTIDANVANVINNVVGKNFEAVRNLGPDYPRDIQYGYSQIAGPGTFPTGQRRHMVVARMDWQPTERVSTYVRDLYNHNDSVAAGGGLNDKSRTGVENRFSPHSLVVSYNHILTSRLLNELRAQVSDFPFETLAPDPIGPGITIPGVAVFGRAINAPNGRHQRRLEWLDNVGIHTAHHDAKLGFDINRVRYTSSLPGNTDGPVGGLGGVFTFPSLQAFLDGNAVNFVQGFGSTGFDQVTWTSGVFAQDTMKIAPGLTLSSGVRYELQKNPRVNNILDPEPHAIHSGGMVAPRIGLSWTPGSHATLVLRTGYGLYDDLLLSRLVAVAGQFNGLAMKTLVLTGAAAAARFRGQNLGFPPGALPNVPPPPGLGGQSWVSPSPIPASVFPPQTITTIDPDLPTPHSHHAHVTVERELARDVAVSAGYIFTRHVDQPGLHNINLPPPIDLGGRPTYNISARTSALPDPRVFINNRVEAIDRSVYHALVVTLRHRFNTRMQFNASYTLSHAVDYITDPFDTPFLSDQNNPDAERANSALNEPQRFVFTGVFVLPRSNSWMGRILGDVTLAPIITRGSGFFYNITTGTDSNGDGVINDRPLGVGRNSFTGDGVATIDLRISKTIRLGQRQLQFLVDGFNLLNTTNFTDFNTVWGTGSYPEHPLATFGRPTQAGDPRIVQVGVRYSF